MRKSRLCSVLSARDHLAAITDFDLSQAITTTHFNLDAERTSGLLSTPTPRVLQRALSDFYVEYEIMAHIALPIERPKILSDLHSHIQDVFNEYGVQIMSPHFKAQPDDVVLVPKANWFEAPASKDVTPEKSEKKE